MNSIPEKNTISSDKNYINIDWDNLAKERHTCKKFSEFQVLLPYKYSFIPPCTYFQEVLWFLLTYPNLFLKSFFYLSAIGGCGSVSRVGLKGFGLKGSKSFYCSHSTLKWTLHSAYIFHFCCQNRFFFKKFLFNRSKSFYCLCVSNELEH